MNRKTDRPDEHHADHDVARLFENATPRPKAPAAHREAVFAAVHAEWDRLTGRRVRRRRAALLALAATLVVSVAWLLVPLQMRPDAASAATTQRIHGVVEMARDGGGWQALPPGSMLRPGDRLRVVDGAAALALANGGSLRIDAETRLVVGQPPGIELDRGRVYFDSLERAHVAIKTPFGTVTDVGTQFSVASDAGGLDVAVRSGSVAVSRASGTAVARAGERLNVGADGVESREPVVVTGEAWAWAEYLAEAFELEGRSYRALLEWYARETGYRLEYASEHARLAAGALMRGGGRVEVRDLAKLRHTLETAGLAAVLDQGRSTLVIMKQD